MYFDKKEFLKLLDDWYFSDLVEFIPPDNLFDNIFLVISIIIAYILGIIITPILLLCIFLMSVKLKNEK
jgi:hypothetical protein